MSPQLHSNDRRIIDLRTDTSTLPTKEMLEAMVKAELGNDGLGEDPTVNELEKLAGAATGKEASLFVPSGTMGNLVSLMSHAMRGDSFIAEEKSHIITHESGYRDIADLDVVRLKSNLGTIDYRELNKFEKLQSKKPKLLVVENTHNGWGGTVVRTEDMKAIHDTCGSLGIAVHLDGARLFNAAAFMKEDASRISACADSVMFCVSKGLCAPVGSLVCGSENFISKCRAQRKVLGGGMRQAGVLASAGIYALKHMVSRLEEDHGNANVLAEGLSEIKQFSVDLQTVQTNIVLFKITDAAIDPKSLSQKMDSYGVKINPRNDGVIRCVTHKDVTREDVNYSIDAFKRAVS